MKIEWRKVTWYSKLLAVVLFVGVFILGLYLGAAYNEVRHMSAGMSADVQSAAAWNWKKYHRFPSATDATSTPAKIKQIKNITTSSSTTPVVKPTATSSGTSVVTPPAAPLLVQTGSEVRFAAYITAYTYWDNTPPGSADISNPIIHQKAGGTGTYNDPITVAVGHSFATEKDVLDYPAGTKFYLPYIKKYFIVEDTCGDGKTPQNGPCHTGYQGHPWLDLWIDGANGTRASSNTCAENLTEVHTIIEHPASNYTVIIGPVYNSACAQQFADAVVTI